MLKNHADPLIENTDGKTIFDHRSPIYCLKDSSYSPSSLCYCLERISGDCHEQPRYQRDNTPWHLIAYHCDSQFEDEFLHSHLICRFSKKEVFNIPNSNHLTPFHLLVARGRLNLARWCIKEKFIEANNPDVTGLRPIEIALKFKCAGLVNTLIEEYHVAIDANTHYYQLFLVLGNRLEFWENHNLITF